MHTLKEMLAAFAAAAQHTHEAAVEALYKLGHSTGAEEVKAKLLAGDQALEQELTTRHTAEVTAARAQRAADAGQLNAANPIIDKDAEGVLNADGTRTAPQEETEEAQKLRLHKDALHAAGMPSKFDSAPEGQHTPPLVSGKPTIEVPSNAAADGVETVIEAPGNTDTPADAAPTVGTIESDRQPPKSPADEVANVATSTSASEGTPQP